MGEVLMYGRGVVGRGRCCSKKELLEEEGSVIRKGE
jgi:hypothetical protein